MNPRVLNKVMGRLQDLGSSLRKKRLSDRAHANQGETKEHAQIMDNPGGDGHPMNHVPEDRHKDTITNRADSETQASPGVLNPPRPEPGDADLGSPELHTPQFSKGAHKDHTHGTTDPAAPHDVYAESNRMKDGKVDKHGVKLGGDHADAQTPAEPAEGQDPDSGHGAPYGMHTLRGMLDELGSAEEVVKPSKGLHQSQDLAHAIDPGHYKVKQTKKGYKLRRKKG